MATFSLQEWIILLFVVGLMLLPIPIVWQGSKRRTGEVSVGWVFVAVLFGWFGALIWMAAGRKAPKQSTPLALNQPPV